MRKKIASACAIAASVCARIRPDRVSGRGFLEAGGVDDGEDEIAETRLAFAPVARHARAVIDQREPPADQAVEQGRLADIRPADDGDGEAHGDIRPAKTRRPVG